MSEMNPTPVADSGQVGGVTTNIPRSEGSYLGTFFKKSFEDQSKIYTRDVYKGEVLFVNTIKLRKFVERFSPDFVTYVLGCKSTTPSDLPNIAYVNESIVFCQEISGCLPYPEMGLVESFLQKYADEIEGDQDPDWKKLAKKSKERNFDKFIKSMKRLDRFPRFYSSSKGTLKAPSRGDIVQVSFLDNNDWSSTGVLLSGV